MSSIVISGDTSGTITLTAPAVAGTNTLTLPANTGTVLTTASGGQSIPKAALPTGSILQVVQVTTGTDTTISATSYTDLSVSASITPTSSSSKVLVLVSLSGRYYTRTNGNRVFNTNIVRGATQIHEVSTSDIQSGLGSGTYVMYPAISSLVYLDSPATTSSTTYKCQGKVSATADDTSIALNQNDGVSTITLMEIAA